MACSVPERAQCARLGKVEKFLVQTSKWRNLYLLSGASPHPAARSPRGTSPQPAPAARSPRAGWATDPMPSLSLGGGGGLEGGQLRGEGEGGGEGGIGEAMEGGEGGREED